MFDTPEEKANQLIEVFSNDNTRDSERKAIKHAIYHMEEMIIVQVNQHMVDYYKAVLKILNNKK